MLRKINSIICIAAGHSQIPIIKAAHDKGFKVVAIDRNAKASGLEYVDEHIILSTLDVKEILYQLQILKTKYNYSGIVCRSSGAVLHTAVAIAEKFNLPGLTKKVAHLATIKSQLREFCFNNQIKMVKGVRVKPGEVWTSNLILPIIVKPDLPIFGKKNITVVWDRANISDAIELASAVSGNKSVEVEEYVEGIDVSILFHMNLGKSGVITYWDELNALNLDNTITGLGVSIPSVISGTTVQQKLDHVTSVLAESFNDVQALMILSVRIDKQGNIFVIELHADLGGDLIADILLPTACSSFDFFNTAVNVSAGKEIVTPSLIFVPTALLYADKNVNIDCKVQVEKINGHYIFHSDTIGDLHCKVASMWRSSEYHTAPLHKEWRKIWEKN